MSFSSFFDQVALIRDSMRSNILQLMGPVFPAEAISSYDPPERLARRDRVFTNERTLLTMVVTALYEDRSLRTSVNIFREVFRRNNEILRADLERDFAARSAKEPDVPVRRRLRTRHPELPASKSRVISSNTAAFSKARDRLDQGLIDHVFLATRDFAEYDCVHKWHGRDVFNTDGTYFQLQDTVNIPEKYRTQKNADGTLQGYPQGLLQVLTQHGSGAIYSYRISGRDAPEMDVLCNMLDDLPANSLLLADDHYNCYALYDLLLQRGIDIIVPDKKRRKYRTLKRITRNDEIVEVKRPYAARSLVAGHNLSQSIRLRRISYPDPKDPKKTRVLYTTILDKSIKSAEIVEKHVKRWDIEVSIKEIKTIMGINIARSKSEAMVFREVGVALLAYNLIRKIIAKGALEASFPPETDIFQMLHTASTPPLVDCKGRVYARWSPGRPAASNRSTQGVHHPKSTGKTLSKKN
jgi:hypothetical protein